MDKVNRISQADWGGSTNIEAVFDTMLRIAKTNHVSQNDIPKSVIIVSDMEFNACVGGNSRITDRYGYFRYGGADETLFETIEKRWIAAGYEMPNLIFWNVQARQDNIPMLGQSRISFVSGFSPSIFETIMSGKTGYDLMMEKLNSERYSVIK